MKFTSIAALLVLSLNAQQVISTKAGLVNLVQGDVTVNDEALVVKNSRFAELKNGDVLRTAEGRAEILLAPGAFIRLSEKSGLRMESNSILNTRIALLDGDALLEVVEFSKDSSLEILIGAEKISIQKPGLYRLDAENLNVKVFNGELAIVSNEVLRKVSEGRMMTLTGDHLVAKFDRKSGDEFSRWASRRSSHIAMANVSAAKDLYDSSYNWTRPGFGFGGWIFNPWYGFYTYVPFGRTFFSPFGYSFFSPGTVYSVLVPQPSSGWGGGNSGSWSGPSSWGMGSTPGGFDRGGASSGMSRGPSFSGGSPSGATSGAVAGGERATGSANAGGARGGGGRAQ